MEKPSFTEVKAQLALLATGVQFKPAVSLLHIAAPFLLLLSKQHATSATVQTIHFLMEEWFVKQNKFDVPVLQKYPDSGFCSYCFHCFHKLDNCFDHMPTTCFHCKAHPSLGLHFFEDMVEYRYKIHPIWIEKVFCEYLLKRDKNHGHSRDF